jgi:very-short-patch-repair endonuclease
MKKDRLKLNGMHDGATPTIFSNAAKLRLDLTPAEKVLWNELKKKPLGFKFRRQHPINFYILDFYCHKKRYHDSFEQKEKDQLRTEYLTETGIKELRFKNEIVLKNRKLVLEEIYKALKARALK